MVTNLYKCAKLKFQRYYLNQIYSVKYKSAKDLLKKKTSLIVNTEKNIALLKGR